MILYEYQFKDEDGVLHRVERRFPMGAAPEQIRVDVGDASYMALRVYGAVLKRSVLSDWATDLPPVNSPVIE
jgi:hypothetical protein